MRATFLGHRAWVLDEGGTVLWVDPLLRRRFGWHAASERVIHPPRTVEPLAPPSAIVISRDREDSIDWPSLERAPRGIPLYLATRASPASIEKMTSLGLAPRVVAPGERLTHGALTLESDGGDGRLAPTFVVRAASDTAVLFGGSCTESAAITRGLSCVPRRWMWSCAFDSFHTRAQQSWVAARRLERVDLVASLLARLSHASAHLGPPSRMCLSGDGYAFTGDRAWLNTHGFVLDDAELTSVLSTCVPFPAGAPEPGSSFDVSTGEIAASGPVRVTCDASPLVRGSLALSRWHARTGPACGRHELAGDELVRLDTALDALAAALYGRPLFRALHSVASPAPTVAWVLLTGSGEAFSLVYDPSERRFVASESCDPLGSHLAVFECWASDLLDVLSLSLPLSAIAQGRCRIYNRDPAGFHFDPLAEIDSHVHTLRARERSR